jgi:hypothetical protein
VQTKLLLLARIGPTPAEPRPENAFRCSGRLMLRRPIEWVLSEASLDKRDVLYFTPYDRREAFLAPTPTLM